MMTDTATQLDSLLASGIVRCRPSPWLHTQPPPPQASFDRIGTMLYAVALGDSLGNTSEGLLPHERTRRYGHITGYLPTRHAGGQERGVPSDDTQLTFRTVQHLLRLGDLCPEQLGDDLSDGAIFGIGRAMTAWLARREAGLPWTTCGVQSSGNGALMRIAPVLLPHLQEPSPRLWADAVLATMVTHNDAAAIACSVAWVHILWSLLTLPEGYRIAPPWWLERFAEAAATIEGATLHRPRQGPLRSYTGPLWAFTVQQAGAAQAMDVPVRNTGAAWGSGAYLLETMPTVLAILMRHSHEPERAMGVAVNDTKDNDTIAALVGSALGALHGSRWIPAAWRTGLLGRLGSDDDGAVLALLQRVRDRWK